MKTATATCEPTDCAPAKRKKAAVALSQSEIQDLALMLKALGHPARVQLVQHLSDSGVCYFGDFSEVVPLAPSTISQHVTILKDAGLVEGSPDERRVCYCLKPERLELLKRLLGRF